MTSNRQLRLARHIKQGEAVSLNLFHLVQGEVPVPGEGEFLVKTSALGTSPAQRAYLMEGFFVWDYYEQFNTAETDLLSWYKSGDLVSTENVHRGLEAAPDALQSLFEGTNCGIKVVEL